MMKTGLEVVFICFAAENDVLEHSRDCGLHYMLG